MRPLLDREHDLPEAGAPSRDLVLGMPALLGIFIGVALVCAACFGFGYRSSRDFHLPERHFVASAGAPAPSARRAPLEPRPLGGSAQEGESRQEAESPETAYPTPAPEQAPFDAAPAPVVRSKPSPSAGLPGPRRALPDELSASPTPVAREQAGAAPTPARLQAQAPASATVPDPETTPALVGAGAMVQIAAVTRAADAQTLANALRHDGFDAMVRTSTDDRFFHVQIGPFPSLQAAKTMRAKLADNGYNAFIKP